MGAEGGVPGSTMVGPAPKKGCEGRLKMKVNGEDRWWDGFLLEWYGSEEESVLGVSLGERRGRSKRRSHQE